MLERDKTFQPKPNTIDELKKVLQTIWDDLPQNSINKTILSFVKRRRACVKVGADTLNTSWNKLFLQGFELLASCDSLKYHTSTFSFDFNTSTMLVAWHSGRTSVSGRRTFPVLRSTYGWWVTTNVGKPSATGQPTRATQPFILTGSIKWVVSWNQMCAAVYR